tara:strand:+ start:291 stop:542 length:252 start_codon:yes stop_codon:yes gene_type:complete
VTKYSKVDKVTKLQQKFLEDLKTCEPFQDCGDSYNYTKADVYKHFINLGWKEKSYKSVLGSLYSKEILLPEGTIFFVKKKYCE